MNTAASPSERQSGLGWVCALLAAAWAALTYRGLATPAGPAWWQPSGFLHQSTWLGELASVPFVGADVVVLALVPAALCVGVFRLSHSPGARTLSVAAVCCSALFGFYGLHAYFPWEFFGTSATAVLVATGLAAGLAATLPFHVDRTLRTPSLAERRVRAVSGAALALLAVAAMRHITGFDSGSRFNLSPWPAFSIFGIEFAGHAIAGSQLALAAALAARPVATNFPDLRIAALLAGGVIVSLWPIAEFGWGTAWIGLLVATYGVPLLAIQRRLPVARQRELSAALGIAGIALAVTIATGKGLATGDHAHSRFVLAERVIDALAAYEQREQTYPDDLDELVAANDLREVPRPRIGFDLLYATELLEPPVFDYHGLGSSYVLEFASAEWVQCAYTPPWIDEDGPEELDEPVEEAWACPDTRPDLW